MPAAERRIPMPLWEISCTVPDSEDVTFQMTSYGHVVTVAPDTSPFASIDPLDVLGFAEPGDVVLSHERAPIAIEDVLRSGEDVIGKVLVLRTSMVFVSSAIARAIRLVTTRDVEAGERSGLIDPADPDYEWKVAEWYQSVTDAQRPGDDAPLQITARQALKLAAIMGAAARGHDGYRDALRDGSCVSAVRTRRSPSRPHRGLHDSSRSVGAGRKVPVATTRASYRPARMSDPARKETSMQLEVSTTPRETWLWAASSAEAGRLRALLSAAGHVVLEPEPPAAAETKGFDPGRIIDIEIGVTAADALDTVRAAGYTLRWHPRQHARNRGTLFGEPMPE